MKLNGWQRLRIVMTVCWALVMSGVTVYRLADIPSKEAGWDALASQIEFHDQGGTPPPKGLFMSVSENPRPITESMTVYRSAVKKYVKEQDVALLRTWYGVHIVKVSDKKSYVIYLGLFLFMAPALLVFVYL